MAFDSARKYFSAGVVFFVMIVAGCSDLAVPPSDTNGNIADFEQAWTITDSVYPYFQFKQINWDSIHTVYKPLAENAKGDEIFTILFDMLAELKDGHVTLKTKGGWSVRTYTPPRTKRDRFTFDPLLVRKYFTEELQLAGGERMEYGILPGNIGYVRIATFVDGEWKYDFDNVLDDLRTTKGLILDVRDNGGGSDLVTTFVVSRFLTSPLPASPVYIHGQLVSGGSLQPVSPAARYNNPVAVLMNGVCFSATEDFLNMMSQVPSATLLGDTSAGGSGAPEDFSLPSGKAIHISTKDIRRYDNRPIEWNGIIPQILVMQTEADVKGGHDFQLESAIKLLR
ncbi:MAG: hypothetical protein KGJ59_12700 [Bacteroidota bacterium]|nr:hypothetical protein [Bacteroidota bacterium]